MLAPPMRNANMARAVRPWMPGVEERSDVYVFPLSDGGQVPETPHSSRGSCDAAVQTDMVLVRRSSGMCPTAGFIYREGYFVFR